MNSKFIFFLLVMIPSLIISQNTLKANFTPEKDFTWGILYKNSPTGKKYVAQSKFVEGNLVFKLNEKATKDNFVKKELSSWTSFQVILSRSGSLE